jgi:hypothetical protein
LQVRLSVIAAGIAALAVLGCAKPPRETIERAERAVKAAREAGAARYAPESLEAAERALGALEAELKAQEKKGGLSRSYGQTESLALEAAIAAERAEAESRRGREKAMADARALVSRVADELSEARAVLAREAGKDRRAAGAASGLREASALLDRARAELAAGRFAESLEHARSAGDKIDAVRGELRKRTPRQPKTPKTK